MQFLRNAWYVAASAKNVSRTLIERTLLGDTVVIYRKEDGGVAVLEGRCCHRFAPLLAGKLIGDIIECGYHGLRFDTTGACVLNPHGDGRIPKGACQKAYPAKEKYGLLWVWMGDPHRSDERAIPDLSHLTSESYSTVRGEVAINANYQLVIDNLMDLTHAKYLHSQFGDLEALMASQHSVEEHGEKVASRRTARNTKAPEKFGRSMTDPDARVDYSLDVEWIAPSSCILDTSVVPHESPDDGGLRRIGTHLVTPIDATNTYYYYANSRDYRLDDAAEDKKVAEWQEIGFHEQDKPMIEGVQRLMGQETDFLRLKPVLLVSDAASVRARRLLSKLVTDEVQIESNSLAH